MNEILSYTAGLIDGEGCITLGGKEGARSPNVGVASTSRELIDFLLANFGGSATPKAPRENRKPGWDWRLSTNATLEFIAQVRPFMREKRKCARIDYILANYRLVVKGQGQKMSRIEKQKRIAFEKTLLSI